MYARCVSRTATHSGSVAGYSPAASPVGSPATAARARPCRDLGLDSPTRRLHRLSDPIVFVDASDDWCLTALLTLNVSLRAGIQSEIFALISVVVADNHDHFEVPPRPL